MRQAIPSSVAGGFTPLLNGTFARIVLAAARSPAFWHSPERRMPR